MAYTTPPTFVSGNTLTAAQLNTNVRDNFKEIGDPWGPYTPVLTNWTLNNGTLTGGAVLMGATVLWRVTFTVGSTTVKSGTLVISLPATSIQPTHSTLGTAAMFDTSTSALQYGFVAQISATTCAIRAETGGGTNVTVPWTWATGDYLVINGSYECIP